MENTLSKLEILNETVKYYSEDVTRRGLKPDGTCVYNTTDGKYCAVGRCFNDEYKTKAEQLFSGKLVIGILDLDDKLNPQYKGHDRDFWYQLQRLHDDECNWEHNGISEEGKEKVEFIKTKFKLTE